MSDWTLTDLPLGEGAYGIAGYAVLDALGIRLGYVAGWIRDPDDRVRMLKLAVRQWFETREFLVPIGSITLIDDDHSQVHLRELTKRSIPKYCLEFEDELPEPQLLKSLIRFFPNPRPSIVERIEKPDEVPAPPSSRLTVRENQGDGSRSSKQPVFAPGPGWTRLEHLTPPDWMQLSNISYKVKWHV